MIASSRDNWMIDAAQPVDWACPLNRGLVSWWLGIPGWTGGRRFIDIANPGPNGNHGVLISMDPEADWKPSPRGVQSLDFNEVDGFVDAGNDSSLDLDGNSFSIVMWIKSNSLAGGFFGKHGDLSNSQTLHLRLNTNTTTLTFGFFVNDLNLVHGLSANEWAWLSFIYETNTNFREVFVNAVSIGSNTASSDLVSTNDGSLQIGRIFNRNDEAFDGLIDDVRIWNRALFPSEIQAVYIDSLQRYPQTLRRLRPAVFPEAVVVTGGINRIIGGGILV